MNHRQVAYTQWRSLDTELQFTGSTLSNALELWHQKCAGRDLPSRRDFAIEDLGPFLGSIALIDVEQEPLRFRYRLIGTGITEMLGRDSTGKYIDQVYDKDFYPKAVGSYTYVLDHRRPVRAFGNMIHAHKGHIGFVALDAPLSTDGRVIDMIIKFVSFVPLRPA